MSPRGPVSLIVSPILVGLSLCGPGMVRVEPAGERPLLRRPPTAGQLTVHRLSSQRYEVRLENTFFPNIFCSSFFHTRPSVSISRACPFNVKNVKDFLAQFA